jgi:cation diffusion facilitator CzcD-associated flavoprotein CzcO
MAPGAEIHAYIKNTTKKFGLDEYIQFNTKVLESIWDEPSGKWKIKIEQNGSVKEDEADFVVNAAGFLK